MNISQSIRVLGIVSAFALTSMIPLQSATAEQTESRSESSPITVSDLADSSATQQRWISEPTSRIALNPSHSQTNDAKPTASNSLDSVFYANQDKTQESDIVTNTFNASTPGTISPTLRYDEGDDTPALSEAFTPESISSWRGTDNGGRISAGTYGGIVSTSPGNSWGGAGKDITLDVTKTPILLVAVGSTHGKWAVKINAGNGDIRLQDDTDAVGTFTYNLSDKVPAGSRKITVKLFTADDGDTTFKALSIHSQPDFEDNFTIESLRNWNTHVQSNNGASITSSPSGQGAVVSSSSTAGFGAVSRPVTVDLSKNPILTIAVGPLSKGSMWALKLTGANGSGDFATIQSDTDETGVFSYNIRSLSGKTGTQTFGIKLFTTKSPIPTSATFTRLSFHNNANSVFQEPSSYVNTWNPESLEWNGSFGDSGSYATKDLFVNDSTVSRLVCPSSLNNGNPVLQGNFSKMTHWDATNQVLTTTVKDEYSRSVAFPNGSSVHFFKSINDAETGEQGTPAPTQEDTVWVATLSRTQRSAVAFGYQYGTNEAAQTQSATHSLSGRSADVVLTALATRTTEWNSYLAKVPSVSNYSLHLTDSRNISSADIRTMYYRSFIDLRQTVVPPQPESGISHYQVATGKAATYNGGSSRNRASASWDSLLGIQYLAYVEPDFAWDSYIGMMSDVGADGNLNGESLPSRKAQTAWMLYTVTGNLENLRSIYPTLRNNLKWSSEHLAWNISSHYPGQGVDASQERDVEYVASLSTDLTSAINIAETLGNKNDVSEYKTLQKNLSTKFAQWFFKNGKAVQFYWATVPDASYQQRAGVAQSVATGLHMPGLGVSETNALLARFNAEYDPNAQFAGLASDVLKAPDAQFVAYGLLEHGQTEKARVFLEATLRDVTSTKAFSEVYQAGNPTISRGESPTTFGMAQVIDNLWILNGYRSDAGTPAFVRLYETDSDPRGVSGLTYLGRRMNITTDASAITVSGDVTKIPGACARYTSQLGIPTSMNFTCGTISLSSESVHVSEILKVNGGGYIPNSHVKLLSDTKTIATMQSDGTGNVSISVKFDKKDIGNHSLSLHNGVITAQAKLQVLAAKNNGITPAPQVKSGTPITKLSKTGITLMPIIIIAGIMSIVGLAIALHRQLYRKE